MRLEDPNLAKKESASDVYIPPKNEKRSIKTEIKKIKSMGFKQGFSYFMDYYKWPVIISVLAIVMIVSITASIIQNSKPYLISGEIYNNISSLEDQSAMEQIFADYLGVPREDYNVSFRVGNFLDVSASDETTYTMIMKIQAEIASEDLDYVGGDKTIINYLCNVETDSVPLADLEEILPADLTEALKDKFFYVTDQSGRKFAAAIDISGSKWYQDMGLQVSPTYVGMIINSTHQDNFIKLLRYAFELPEGT